MSERSIKKLCKLADQMNALSVAAKNMSSGDQVESGLSDEGGRLYDEILKEVDALALPPAMTANQTIDGVPRELLERCARVVRKPRDETVRRRALSELRAMLDTERCTSCDGSGDLVDLTGEWRGYCVCPIGVALKNKPAAQSQSEQVAIDDNVEFEKWWMSTPILRKQKIQIAQEAWFARAKLAEQPAPVAVVMPERMTLEKPENHTAPVEIHNGVVTGWNACLDEVARLNTK